MREPMKPVATLIVKLYSHFDYGIIFDMAESRREVYTCSRLSAK